MKCVSRHTYFVDLSTTHEASSALTSATPGSDFVHRHWSSTALASPCAALPPHTQECRSRLNRPPTARSSTRTPSTVRCGHPFLRSSARHPNRHNEAPAHQLCNLAPAQCAGTSHNRPLRSLYCPQP